MGDITPQLDALNCVSPEMKKRLRIIIQRGDPNFVLVGSDPSEEGGCCPSSDVGHANALVSAGILESWQAGCGKSTCPGTFYAFRGERIPDTSPTEFKVNEELRASVEEYLGRAATSSGLLRKTLQTALLAFVAVCIGVLIARDIQGGKSRGGGAARALTSAASSLQDGYLVSVVKTAPGCSSCETMEANTQKTLGEHYSARLGSGEILYASISAYGDDNRAFREDQEILATSLVLMKVKDGEVGRRKVLTDIWQVLNDEAKFIELLNTELARFMELQQ